jgi:glutathione S-transferase
MLTFWFSPGASSMATHIALHEVGAEFDARLVSLPKRETHTAEFLAMNPDGKVPTLSIDGHILTEVAGTLFYIARRYPRAGLLPSGEIEAEAQVVSWMSFLASTVHPARRVGVGRLHEVFSIAEQKLGGAAWAVENYSIADIHLFRLFWRWMNSGGPEPGTFPGLAAHYERMMSRPAVQRVLRIESAIGYELPA